MPRASVACAAVGVFLAICLPNLRGAGEPKPLPSPENDQATLVANNNEFALALHRRLAAKSDANFVMSPLSISTALAIVHAGARGETATEMERALHFSLPADRQAKGFERLLAEMNARDGNGKRRGELIVANALWAQKRFPFRKDFLSMAQDHYQADLRLLDFEQDPDGGRKEINRWIEAKTRDKIRELIQPDQVDAQTKLVVTNAVYLNKSWWIRFHKDATKDEPFHTGKEKRSVPMMHARMEQVYYCGEGVQVLQLPYDDGRLAMLFVLPDEARGLAKLEQELDWAKLGRWIRKLELCDVEVSVPRVSVEARNHLPETLKAMGMRLAFTKEADFSGMVSGGGVCISDVIHQAYLSVDENETEAAAATAVIVFTPVSDTRTPDRKATFRADRPFLVIIRDTRTDAIVFTGRVADPGQ